MKQGNFDHEGALSVRFWAVSGRQLIGPSGMAALEAPPLKRGPAANGPEADISAWVEPGSEVDDYNEQVHGRHSRERREETGLRAVQDNRARSRT